MTPRTLAATIRNFFGAPQATGLPTQRLNWLGPRFEPTNISAIATVIDIQSAIRQAEWGETTSLFRFYRDCLLGDDHVQGELGKRKLAVIGQPLAVLPADKSNEEDAAAAAACMRAIQDCDNWNTGLGMLLSASQWPVSVAENIFRAADARPVVWGKAEGRMRNEESGSSPRELRLQYTLKRLEPVNPMLFCFRHAYLVGGMGIGTATPAQFGDTRALNKGKTDVGGPGWYSIDLEDWEPFIRLWPIDDQGRIIYDASRASKLDPDRHVVHRGHLLTDQRDNWGGPMRAILFWWLLRGLERDWFGRFMERYGAPFPVATTNVQDKESVALLEQAFSLATKIGGLVIGQDDRVELQQAMVQGGAEGHKTWHDVCNNAISRHITGYGSSEKPSGLNAGEEGIIQGVRADIRIFDGKLLAETLQKQVFARFLKFNGLPGAIRITVGGLSSGDAKTFADLLKTSKEAGWEPTDEAVPTVGEKLGLEMQRVAPPPMPDLVSGDVEPQEPGEEQDQDQDQESVTTDLSGRDPQGRLTYYSTGTDTPSAITHHASRITHLVTANQPALAAAYKGSMAPFRQIILESPTREECERRLARAYADWTPSRLVHELDTALQLCSATAAHESH